MIFYQDNSYGSKLGAQQSRRIGSCFRSSFRPWQGGPRILKKNNHMSNEKTLGCLGYVGDLPTQFTVGIIISQYKDAYQTTSIVQMIAMERVPGVALELNFGSRTSSAIN